MKKVALFLTLSLSLSLALARPPEPKIPQADYPFSVDSISCFYYESAEDPDWAGVSPIAAIDWNQKKPLAWFQLGPESTWTREMVGNRSKKKEPFPIEFHNPNSKLWITLDCEPLEPQGQDSEASQCSVSLVCPAPIQFPSVIYGACPVSQEPLPSLK